MVIIRRLAWLAPLEIAPLSHDVMADEPVEGSKGVVRRMQSGPIVAVRAMVMLACMIVVPLVAIFWKHWPESIDLARAGRWRELVELGARIVTQSGPQPSTAHEGTPEAPSFAASGATNTAAAAPLGAPSNPFTSPPPAPSNLLAGTIDPGSSASSQEGTPAQGVAPARFQMPVNHAPSPSATGPSATPAPVEPPAVLPPHLAQAVPSTAVPPQANPFRDMEQRLRSLGATYYLLESWGTEGNLYRFHVKMALAGNPNYNRHFEATDADPLAAMHRVLDEVEAWRSGRQL